MMKFIARLTNVVAALVVLATLGVLLALLFKSILFIVRF